MGAYCLMIRVTQRSIKAEVNVAQFLGMVFKFSVLIFLSIINCCKISQSLINPLFLTLTELGELFLLSRVKIAERVRDCSSDLRRNELRGAC